jgi:hypothetical protein
MGKVTLVAAAISCWLAGAARGADLVVTNASDLVNGDTSSLTALIANPGPDGISLREAILAVNNSRVPAAIGFDSTLAGGTITLDQPLPPLFVDGTAIDGSAGGSSRITLDLSRITGSNCPGLILAASGLTVTDLRFANVTPLARALQIYAGVANDFPCAPTTAPQQMRDISVLGCEFDNSSSSETAYAVSIGTGPPAHDSRVSNVQLLRNRFIHFQGDGTTVHLQVGGERNVLENVTIADNSFADCMFAVELPLCCGGQRDDHIRDIFILRNRFERGGNTAISGNTIGRYDSPLATGNSIERVVIDRNTVLQQNHWAIILNGGTDNASENVIEDVRITNNVIARGVGTGGGGILMIGGDVGGTSNRVDHVEITNNTIVFNEGAGVALADNPGGTGNSVKNVIIRNSIFWPNVFDLHQSLTPADVENCITANQDLIGLNGNFSADPRFVDPGQGDFHLQVDSPAIGKGTIEGAPCVDLDGFARLGDGKVDIGAYEFHSAAIGRAVPPCRSRSTRVVPPRSPIP